jgi:hypothetical protein
MRASTQPIAGPRTRRHTTALPRASNRFLGDIPLVVLTHGKVLPLEQDKSEEQVLQNERVLQETQADLVKLSSNSVQVIAEKSGHYIHLDEPRLVVAAIHEVVDAVRAHRKVDKERVLAYAGKVTP